MELQSFIHHTRNPEYASMVNELAEFAIPDLGLLLIFFTVVYPYQIAVFFALLVRESSKTAEIYTHELSISNKNIQSPLDGIDEILNLVTSDPRRPVENGDIDAIR